MNITPRSWRPLGAALLLALLALLAGCAQEDSTPAEVETAPASLTPEQEAALIQRVTNRWKAMVAKDFGATYRFTTPTYRSFFSKSMYLKNFSYAVDWELTGVEVVEYDADAAVASVAVRVMSKPTKQTSQASIALGALPATIREKWLMIDGKWWHSAKL